MTVEAPPRPRSMAVRVLVGLGLLVIGGLALLSTLGGGETETATTTFSGVEVIELELDNASAEIVAGGEEVVIDKEVRLGLWGGSAQESQTGEVLRVTLDCRALLSMGCGGSYRIALPATTEIRAESSNGRFELEGLDGAVDVHTSNGAITLDGLRGPVEARTSNGAIDGSELAAPVLVVGTSNGRISLSFAAAPERVEADTSNGAIEVLLPTDSPPYVIEADTSNGEVDAGVRTDPGAAASLDLRTSNGDITVDYR